MCWLTTIALVITSVTEVPNPRLGGGWVTDMADVLPADAEQRIDDAISALHAGTTAEIAVVTVDDVAGTPKAFATELFNHWGIGDATENNGLLILLVMDQRRLEMETGYGMEAVLPDGWLGTMQAQYMVPQFKAGDYAAGIEAGLAQVLTRLDGPAAASALADIQPLASVGAPGEDSGSGVPGWLSMLAIFLLPIVPLWLIYRFFRVRYHRRCKTCQIDRQRLPEHEDDQMLDAGQRKEEQLGSVDYHVYVCGQCSSTSTMANRAWFSGYSRCSSCRYRTMTSTSTTIRSPTYDSSGLAQVTEDCRHCSHHRTYTRTIAKLTRPSSSSSSSSSSSYSSGGSSFGGGSSGGGGAGSSW